MLVHLCCDLYRSPSWPVWAPRIPNSYQNPPAQPFACETNTSVEPLSSHQSSLSNTVTRTRFWSASSPLSSRCRPNHAQDSTASDVAKNARSVAKQQEPLCVRNGFSSDASRASDCRVNNELVTLVAPGVFRMPDVPRHAHKNYERKSYEARNERNATNEHEANLSIGPIAKPRISHAGWRGISKTCDCIEKGKTSPVLRLVDQARAVSSPDPLHRPDNQRASLRSATTAQTLR